MKLSVSFISGIVLATIITAPSARADVITMTSDGTTYQFDPVAASAYFNNAFTGTVTSSCTNSVLGCEAFNAPPVPPAPAPDLTQTLAQAINLDGIFFSGGALTSTSYQQVSGSCETGIDGVGTWCFAYTYEISPDVSSVAP